MNKYAAIDLGTNTFHLLIVSFGLNGEIIEHLRDRQYIHLAENGIDLIGQAAIERALNCIILFNEHLSKHDIASINCTGTAALRTASNGKALCMEITKISGFEVDIIDGIQEARYIYQGVQQAVPTISQGNHIIMDIGGGSVEFIIIKNGHFYWSNSYPVGIAVLKRRFHKNEPISKAEIDSIDFFLERHLRKFIYECKYLEFDSLIGASGSFEVLSNMMGNSNSENLSVDIPKELFENTYDDLISLDLTERLNRSDIPQDRASLIIVAFHLMKFILSKIKIKKITVSAYALKEGVLIGMKEKGLINF